MRDLIAASEFVRARLDSGQLTTRDVALLTTEFQEANGLEVDGMPGVKTLEKLRGEKPIDASRPRDLESAGRLALAEAIRLFETDIWDPPKNYDNPVGDRWRDAITEMIRSDLGLGWSWEGRYVGDGDFEWCGAFAARCWSVGGVKLSERKTYFASTYRLRAWASYSQANEVVKNPRPSSGPIRLIVGLDENSDSVKLPDGSSPRAGDILLVGGVNTGPGKHVTLVESFDAPRRVFNTIEGNARGRGPDGRTRQGVVRASRPLGLPSGASPTTYHARWLIRPASTDLE